jgi:ADP-heptose:LPS heptosyltransferase
LGADFRDFADTAAVVQQLDLVITVDTSMAHLAGGLGKPVWVLIPWRANFFWLLERTDSPWYPTARLFRQKRVGDWSQPVQEMRDALRELVARRQDRDAR